MTEVPVVTFSTISPPQPRQKGTNRPLIRPSRPYALGEWDYDEQGAVRYGDDSKPLEAYTRVSTLASYLDDQVGLRAWELGNVAIGVARHQDLQGLLAPLEWNDEDVERWLDVARDRMGSHYKANLGTALHALVEPPVDLTNAPDWLARDAQSYLDELDRHEITQLEAEQFVVCDQIDDVDAWNGIKSAGTFDRVLHVPALERIGQNPRVVLDVKTGKFHYRALSVQLTCYSHGYRYDHESETRRPLDVNREWALCAHVPQGEGRTILRWVDLRQHGYRALKLALALRTWRGDPMPRHNFEAGPFAAWSASIEASKSGDPEVTDHELDVALATAPTIEDLRQIWRQNAERMTGDRSTIARQRALILQPTQ